MRVPFSAAREASDLAHKSFHFLQATEGLRSIGLGSTGILLFADGIAIGRCVFRWVKPAKPGCPQKYENKGRLKYGKVKSTKTKKLESQNVEEYQKKGVRS